jgi:NADH-quinone oxidoreductase E subunit
MKEKLKETIYRLMERFPEKGSALLPVLSFIQKKEGHISEDNMKYVAGIFKVSQAKVFSTASYYSLLSFRPLGKYNIQVCTNIVCSLLDSSPLIDHISNTLNIKTGETTPDGLFSLTPVECIAACAYAPAILINMERYENLTPEKFDEVIDLIKERERGK